MSDDIRSIVNDFPTNRASCGMFFHDLDKGGQSRICTLSPGHTSKCSDNVPTITSVEQQKNREKLNQHHDSFMRSILPDFFKGGE